MHGVMEIMEGVANTTKIGIQAIEHMKTGALVEISRTLNPTVVFRKATQHCR
jgi:hypothetical protein